ncbi:MAG: hypothetical protein RL011_2250 [Pseudomonadota bacterium]|jgi:pyrophosphate--fructose-6-phosphate 1-phosphotransferase
MTISAFQKARAAYKPKLPSCLEQVARIGVNYSSDGATRLVEGGPVAQKLAQLFPHTYPLTSKGVINFTVADSSLKTTTGTGTGTGPLHVGVVLSGGPAPGGHNVIWGVVDAVMDGTPGSRVTGFYGGPAGILAGRTVTLDRQALEPYRNAGGFDLLGTSRSKIDSPEKLATCRRVLDQLGLDALVIIGGDDSNTNAALLAEYLKSVGSTVAVIGVPKTIDGDLQNSFVETTFGFDSAVRVYSELVSNISRDTLSGRKYYHFVRLMGRAASHITMEVALQTQPTIALIAEEVAAKRQTLGALVEEIAGVIKARADQGKNYGVVLVPEGIIEFIPEMRALIEELNAIIAAHKEYLDSLSGFTEQSEYMNRKLSRDASYTFSSLPIDIQRQLLMDRDPHGNVALSRVETEKLLIELITSYLKEEKSEGRFRGTFGYQHHFLGYEGRCAAPTNFDANYAYSLGRTAAALAAVRASGYMAVVRNLGFSEDAWQPSGVPLLAMMTVEERGKGPHPVIKKTLVNLDGPAFKYFARNRPEWQRGDEFRYSGPIQYFGPSELTDRVPLSLALESGASENVNW